MKSIKPFKIRHMVSFTLVFVLLILAVSSIVLYIQPKGRVANWTFWTFLGIDRDQWATLHMVTGFMGVVLAIWHLVLNWKTLLSYMRNKISHALTLKKELLVAFLLFLLILGGSFSQIPPFSTLLEVGDQIKEGWDEVKLKPPFPHAELSTVREICEHKQLDYDKAVKRLKEKGIQDTNQPLLELAKDNYTYHPSPAVCNNKSNIHQTKC